MNWYDGNSHFVCDGDVNRVRVVPNGRSVSHRLRGFDDSSGPSEVELLVQRHQAANRAVIEYAKLQHRLRTQAREARLGVVTASVSSSVGPVVSPVSAARVSLTPPTVAGYTDCISEILLSTEGEGSSSVSVVEDGVSGGIDLPSSSSVSVASSIEEPSRKVLSCAEVVVTPPVACVGGDGLASVPRFSGPVFPQGYCYLALVGEVDRLVAASVLGACPTVGKLCQVFPQVLRSPVDYFRPCLYATSEGKYHVSLGGGESLAVVGAGGKGNSALVSIAEVLSRDPDSVVGAGSAVGNAVHLADADDPMDPRVRQFPYMEPEPPNAVILCNGIDGLVSNVVSVGRFFDSLALPGVRYAAATATLGSFDFIRHSHGSGVVVDRPPGATKWGLVVSDVGKRVANLRALGPDVSLDGPVLWFCSTGRNICLEMTLLDMIGFDFHVVLYSDMSVFDAADVEWDEVFEDTERGLVSLFTDHY